MHGVLNEDAISQVIISQLCSNPDIPAAATVENSYLASTQRLATYFVRQFGKEWESSRHSWGTSDDRGGSDDGRGGGLMALGKSPVEDLVFQYHMRTFSTQSGPRGKMGSLIRVSGTSTVSTDYERNLDIFEIRHSVGLKTTWELDLPVFTLVTMTDSFTGLDDLGELSDTSIWAAVNIRPSLRATGVAAFAFRIRSLLPGWAAHWSRLLNQIDRALSADVSLGN